MASSSPSPVVRLFSNNCVAFTSQVSKTAPLVLSDSEEISSDLSDYDSHSDVSYHAASRATSTTTKKKRPSRASLTSSHNKKRWTHAEDKLLIKAVDQYGNDWVEVEKSLERSGVEAVRGRALRKRHKFIEEAARRQVEIARHTSNGGASASTSSSTQEFTVATLIAASAALHSRAGTQIFQAWTQHELAKLKEIGPQASSLQDVFPASVRAFPTTTRSKHSVNIKWQRMRFGRDYGKDKGRKRRRRAVEESEEEDDDDDEDESDGDESEEEDEEQLQQQQQVQPHAGSKRQRYHPPANRSYTPSGFAPAFHTAAPRALTTATQPLNAIITRTTNGFLIQACPPGYDVLVSSPTSIQLVKPTWWSSHEHQEEVAESLLAVKRLADGSFQAVKLPEGCETNIAVVRAGRGGGEFWVQTSFTMRRTGFSVVFLCEAM